MWVLDYGCANGKLIEELIKLNIPHVVGTDISYYAINSGREQGLPLEYHNVNLLTESFDVIMFLDVLEHVPSVDEIRWWLRLIPGGAMIVVRIPVSADEGEDFVFEASRKDKTHVQCHTKEWWSNLFGECGIISVKEFRGEGIWESSGVMARLLLKGVEC